MWCVLCVYAFLHVFVIVCVCVVLCVSICVRAWCVLWCVGVSVCQQTGVRAGVSRYGHDPIVEGRSGAKLEMREMH